MKNYKKLLEKYQDVQSEIDYDLISKLNEKSNNLYRLLNNNFNKEFNKR